MKTTKAALMAALKVAKSWEELKKLSEVKR